MNKLVSFLLLSCLAQAQTVCTVHQLKIGRMRDAVLADLRLKGCDLRINPPDDGLEDDLVLLSKVEDYEYHELIFVDGKLTSVWGYSPSFTSADMAFAAFFRELAVHSYPDPAADRKDKLGQRNVDGRVFLQRPVLENQAEKIGIDVENGSIFFQSRREKEGTTSVRVAVVRTH